MCAHNGAVLVPGGERETLEGTARVTQNYKKGFTSVFGRSRSWLDLPPVNTGLHDLQRPKIVDSQ